jgi:hypothetical protein
MAEQDVKKTETPLMAPPPVASPDTSGQTFCQWFLGEKAFCDKIKKEVKCDGNTGKCPFCK